MNSGNRQIFKNDFHSYTSLDFIPCYLALHCISEVGVVQLFSTSPFTIFCSYNTMHCCHSKETDPYLLHNILYFTDTHVELSLTILDTN